MLLLLMACSASEGEPQTLLDVEALASGPQRTEIVVRNLRPQRVELRYDRGPGAVYRMLSPQGERFTLDQRDDPKWPRHCDQPCTDPDWECEPPGEFPWPVLGGGSQSFDWNGDLRRYTEAGCFETFRPEGQGWTLELYRTDHGQELLASARVGFPVERVELEVPVDLGPGTEDQTLLQAAKAQIGEPPEAWLRPVTKPTKQAAAEIGSVVYRLDRAEETWELSARRGEDTLWASALQEYGGAGPQHLELQIAGDLVLVWGSSPTQRLVQGFHRDDGRSLWAWTSALAEP